MRKLYQPPLLRLCCAGRKGFFSLRRTVEVGSGMEMYISPSPGPPFFPFGVEVRKGGERLVDVVDGEGVDAPRKRNPG